MTPSDDEVLARLRAALQTVADRTPTSAGRLDEIVLVATEKRTRATVTIVSAAAAVAAIAAVAAVVANTNSSDSQLVLPASGGSPSVAATASDCVPENYGVIASAAELEGLTYLLPATPVGYHLYGAWGTTSRNRCASSVTWYVEYDANAGPGDVKSIQLEVMRQDSSAPGGDPLRAEAGIAPTLAAGNGANSAPVTGPESGSGSASASTLASAPPSPGASSVAPPLRTTVAIGGHPGTFLAAGTGGVVVWAAAGDLFQITGPLADGKPDSLVALANALVAVPTDDPRIVAPANCQVPAGQVCPD
jgi:hypothetical protein